jgi:predicted ATPase/transcriptional regulator with XRE-family HTH domain
MSSSGPADFGTMVRERRRSVGLTQERLAERAGISVRTIADLERGVIRAPHRATLDLLINAFGLGPEEQTEWRRLREALAVTPPAPLHSSRLPVAMNQLIGRMQEVSTVVDLISTRQHRLVTITGPGGVGKTRIALDAGHKLVDHFRDGVHFVDLAPVRQPGLFLSTIARNLGLHAAEPATLQDRLIRSLSQRHILLILDNAEHLRSAAGDLATLLASSDSLHLLVTSRAGLRITAQYEYPISPLKVPDRDFHSAFETVQNFPAIQLFVQRAQQVRPEFTLNDENSDAVVRICTYLDGLPLAIELAAARVKLLPPSRIVPRLIDQLNFLTDGMLDAPDRHQTMRAAIDWSYSLLDRATKRYFRRLSTFVDGWTLEAAEAIAPEDIDPVDGLSTLINDSLILQTAHSEQNLRFNMLETVREFGLEQLQNSNELDEARQIHAWYFLEFAEAAAPELIGPAQAEWLERMESELGNLRRALESLHHPNAQPDPALRAVSALAWFWEARGYAGEGREWLKQALSIDAGAPVNRMKALSAAGWFAHIQQDSPEAREHLGVAIELARELGERWWEAWLFHLLGRVAYFDGDPETAEYYASNCLKIAWELGDRWLEAWAEHLFALARFISDDLDAARQHHQRSLEIRTVIGYPEGVCLNTGLLGVIALREGDHRTAYQFFRDALTVSRQIGARWLIINWIANIVLIAAKEGSPDQAALLAGAVDSMSDLTGAYPIPISESSLRQGRELAREHLGVERFDQLFLEGRRLTLDQAIKSASNLEW